MIGIEYKTANARKWRKASVRMHDTPEARTNLAKDAAMLAVEFNWLEWRIFTE